MSSPFAKPSIPLVLASASPRRRDLLLNVGIGVDVEPVDADEARLGAEPPTAYVERVACAKLALHLARPGGRDAWVLTADTTVSIDGDVLGKPTDDAHARAMLARLAGREHQVSTAIALGRPGRGQLASRVVSTAVRFRAASGRELDAYVATGEGRDKAGAYAIQGIGSGFVLGIDGSYTNVVGLPVAETIAMLLAHGALAQWP